MDLKTNILIDPLPTTIYNGEIEIFTDFRNWILFELLLQSNELNEIEKIDEMIRLTIKPPYERLEKYNPEILIKEIINFYAKKEIENKGKNNDEKAKQIYSYEYDNDYIFSSFYRAYNIDLTTVKMHWWKFKALFQGLPEDSIMVKIMGYRGMKITSKMSKEEQRFYREKKKIFALPDNRTEEEKETDFAESLFKGFMM